MKKILALLMALCLTVGMAACGAKQADQPAAPDKENAETETNTETPNDTKDLPKITFYHGYFQDDWQPAIEMRKIYDDFAELHKDEFIFEAVPVEAGGEGIYNKCIQEISGGNFPDIVDTSGWNIVPPASEAGVILDLKPYIDADETFKEGIGVNYEQNLVDGKIYTVREQMETMGFWYNEDLFQKAGADTPDKWQTWDDFVVAVDKLAACPDVKTPFSMNQGWPTDILFNAVLLGSEEGRDFLAQPLTTFDNPAFKDAVTFVSDNALGRIDTAYFGAADSENYRDDFLRGDAAMLFNGVWEAGSLTGDIGVDPSVIKPAVFPTQEPGKTAAIMSASCGYVISNKMDEAKTAAAVEFVKYMCSPEIAERIFKDVLAMPAYLGMDYDKFINDDSLDYTLVTLAEACKAAAQADYQTRAMNVNWSQDTALALGGKYAAMHNGSKTADEIVSELDQTLGE